jgi:hypothetical protein
VKAFSRERKTHCNRLVGGRLGTIGCFGSLILGVGGNFTIAGGTKYRQQGLALVSDQGFTPPYVTSYRGMKLPRVSAGFGRFDSTCGSRPICRRWAAGGDLGPLYRGGRLEAVGDGHNSIRRWIAALWARGATASAVPASGSHGKHH